MVWTTWWDPSLGALLEDHADIEWVQLVTAGADGVPLGSTVALTSAKGAYAEPIAEFVLGSAIALLRSLPAYARLRSWTPQPGRTLHGARVTVLGGGGIAAALTRLLQPFEADVTVVRRHSGRAVAGAAVVGVDEVGPAVGQADLVVVALALTPETEQIVDADLLAQLDPGCILVNVARGRHVDTDALVQAFEEDRLAGAVLDVTDPEPLPVAHPFWRDDRVLVTPHVACTQSIARRLLLARISENVRRRVGGAPLVGTVDPEDGY